jgi:hypothetical protein
MFVLLIGLMGVAALLPAGRYQIMQGGKTDNASMVGRAAFRDLKARGYLNPTNWRDSSNTVVFPSATGLFLTPNLIMTNSAVGNALTPAVAIDPLGLAANYGSRFPYSTAPSPSPMTRIVPHSQTASFTGGVLNNPATTALADPIFRSGDDLVYLPNTTGRDLPPFQRMILDGSSPPNNLKRASEGSYSWVATIVTDPTSSALSSKVIVSVIVFYKRDLSAAGSGERILGVNSLSFPEVGLNLNASSPAIKPGQWILLTGSINNNNYARWYRVVSSDAIAPGSPPTQFVTLSGPDWTPIPAASTAAWTLDNVVAVYEKNMRLEIP